MKKLIMFFLVASMVVFMPLVASAADSIEGSVQGFTCVTQGKVCPVGKEDPMAAAERLFVVLLADNTYYFVTNVDRAVMARHINDRVRVTGKVDAQNKAVIANTIDMFEGGKWKQTWSIRDQLETNESIAVPFGK